ncbi:alpha-E domain-containing protein [Paenibacillus sp. B01]|uniref:alpha-E domain-containing protein n=1 Tax=Paenibacillus sp. B01 TaxID=2660554 RepID=UPI00129AACFB|nr:alpha-E domain-containing protein [Paenibacillus sp. B01]QGG57490.1 alpha-E domain-containing protein [Paenibacillus sp. B01]
MLNRNAEALCWIGRYMERTENHARFVDVLYHLQQLQPREAVDDRLRSEVDNAGKWALVVGAIGDRKEFESAYDGYYEDDVLQYVTMDRANPNSMLSCVSAARANLRTLREKLPGELWDALNGMYLWLRERQEDGWRKEAPHAFFRQMKDWASLFQGYSQSVMPRENEWRFLECGRYLERMENTLRILQAVRGWVPGGGWHEPEAYPYLQAVLRSISGYDSFRRYHADGLGVDAIMEFVLLNAAFPRSVQYSLRKMDTHLSLLEAQEPAMRARRDKLLRSSARVLADLACLERDDLLLDRDGRIVAHLLEQSRQLGAAMEAAFFRLGEATA